MGTFANLTNGFWGLLTLPNLAAVFAGTVLGTVVGVLPGLGPTATMAILLPLTLGMGPATGMIMLSGILFGSQYGGSTTSILLHIPGEASSVITCLDGYEMSKKGRAGAALTASAIGSFVAATIGLVGLTAFAMPLARFALKFGPPEYFAIAAVGLIVLANVSGGDFWRSISMVVMGIVLATIGMDPVLGSPRFNYGSWKLGRGIDYITVLIGLFGMGEILHWAMTKERHPEKLPPVRLRELYPTREEWRRMVAPILRGGVIGFFVGLLPGPGAITSTYVSYTVERTISKRPEEFGRGAIEGVAGPEAANNAGATGQMVPLLSLGLPFSALTAILLGCLQMQGITPGPFFIVQRPEVFWVLIASFYLGNVVLLLLNLPLVSLFAMVLRIPMWILMAVVTLMCIVGTYSLDSEILDVWFMLVFGVVGFFLRRFKFESAPLVLGMVFGPLMERSLSQALILFNGDISGFWKRPISGTILKTALLAFLIVTLVKKRKLIEKVIGRIGMGLRKRGG
jgi:putative tricarboxylic transport membrane protein